MELSNLNPKQREAVTHTKGPLLVLAGAGSGKTTVLVNRIAYILETEHVSAYNILAITFTNKAAKEMLERITALVGDAAEDMWISTFHSACVKILRRTIHLLGYENDFVIYDSADSLTLIKECLKELHMDEKLFPPRLIASVISKAKDNMQDCDAFLAVNSDNRFNIRIAEVYKIYQKKLKKNNALDFDDIILNTVKIFIENPDVLENYQKRFKYIMVDEYQDTNNVQYMLISLLAQGSRNICVVGDDDQSIYKFRGANIRNILDFEKEYPEAVVIRLEQNYRSTGNILSVANEVIEHNVGRKGKKLWTENEPGSAVAFANYPDDRTEAATIAGIIKEQTASSEWDYSDYAILYRTNAQSRSFEEQLIFKGIPYKLIGSVNFYQRKEIKDLLAYLRTIDNGSDDIAVKRILNIPRRGIGQTTIDRIDAYAAERNINFYNALMEAAFIPGLTRSLPKIEAFVSLIEIYKGRSASGSYTLKELMDSLLEDINYIEYIKDTESESADDRIENINELINKMATFDEESLEPRGLSDFLEEVALVADIDNLDESTNVVLLMTLHSAKGLEFPNVFLVGMEEGIFPGYMSINAENPDPEIEEERRLCYVGITRAMNNLYLSAAKQRMIRGELQYNSPSRFIGEIPRYMLHVTTTAKEKRLSETGLQAAKMSDTRPRPKLYNDIFDKSKAPAKNIGTAQGTLPEYEVGDTVSHVKFGQGTVLELVRGGRDYEVTVEFDAFGIKKMMCAFANLKKIN